MKYLLNDVFSCAVDVTHVVGTLFFGGYKFYVDREITHNITRCLESYFLKRHIYH